MTPRRRIQAPNRKLGLVSSLFALAVLASGCAQPAQQSDVEISHVHGLALVDGNLYVASHHGLAVGTPSGATWSWAYAGTERFDLMGFTVDEAGNFYSSGHPNDPRSYGGVNLGLRHSSDQGETWQTQSLQGQADFHALTARSGVGNLAAYWRGSILESTDGGRTWNNATSPAQQVLALAASRDALWAGAMDGLYARVEDAWHKQSVPGAIASISTSKDGQTLWATQLTQTTGAIWYSSDGGQTWSTAAGHRFLQSVQAPVLFAIDDQDSRHVFASTAGGDIIESKDGGASWKTIRG